MKETKFKIIEELSSHQGLMGNIDRKSMIEEAVKRKEAIVSKNGALATWTPPESTGRSPKDTMIVKRKISEKTIDWDSPNNIPVDEDTFTMILNDAFETIKSRDTIYSTDRVIGADISYALPVKTISTHALTTLFTDNMFREMPEDINKSVLSNDVFLLLVLPYDKLDPDKYAGRLRVNPATGKTSQMAIVMDFDYRIGVVYGSAYGGSVKKLMFTVMNYLLPPLGILPLHCSANEGKKGDSALFLGLSGTGKTTISSDPERALLGDDEHGWSDRGVANFENGCYAKMININPEKEPEIYDAVMHEDDYLKHGVIVENAMIYPDGKFDFNDNRLTENSRSSYPLSYLSNIKKSSVTGHPGTIIFLTADANGVLPPISKLTKEQAMFWFLMGYTSKLAGTETGITEPVSTFSRFFGQPFMPAKPDVYATMLGEKMDRHDTKVFLVNTGWVGGPYGVGNRIDINYTRAMVNAALNGELENVKYIEDKIFHVMVPESCPGVPDEILVPSKFWEDKDAYTKRCHKLANDFKEYFEKEFAGKVDKSIEKQCPGM